MPDKIIRLMTCRKRLILVVAVLILSSIVVVNMLLVSAPVVIQIEGDTFRVIDIPYSYTTKDAYVLLVMGLVSGMAVSQLLFCLKVLQFEPEQTRSMVKTAPDTDTNDEPQNTEQSKVILRALEGDEKKTIEIMLENGGDILQNELVNSLDFSKAKVSRILMNLERRGIVSKSKYGLTNRISLADDIRGEKR
ncbi:MAG: hypothetical protein M8353_05620 [ANME-2 cluster archaeon]|nr:hypothetical protein [ANME-2 cluster archaeon]